MAQWEEKLLPIPTSNFWFPGRASLTTNRLRIERARASRISQTYLSGLRDDEIIGMTESRFVRWNYWSAARFITRANRKGSSILFAVSLIETGRWIGNVRFFNWHPHHRSFEISFIFFDKSEWNKGFAHEAILSLLVHAKNEFGARRVYGDYYQTNLASKRLFQKLNFEIEGIAKRHFLLDGEEVNSVRVGRLLNEL